MTNPHTLVMLTTARGLNMNGIGGLPEMTAKDTALALKGVPLHQMSALFLHETGDDSYIGGLHLRLLECSMHLREREGWPKRIDGELYVEPLSWLAIDEWKSPGIRKLNGYWRVLTRDHQVKYHIVKPVIPTLKTDATNSHGLPIVPPQHRPVWAFGWWRKRLDVIPSVWAASAEPRYEEIRAYLITWRDAALARMRRNIGSRT